MVKVFANKSKPSLEPFALLLEQAGSSRIIPSLFSLELRIDIRSASDGSCSYWVVLRDKGDSREYRDSISDLFNVADF
jgi:hypothetical protein